jgi:hypothetical protein
MHSEATTMSNSSKNRPTSILRFFSPSWKSNLLVIFGLLNILAIFRLKIFINIDKYYLGSIDGDAGLYIWLLKTNIRDLFYLPWFEKTAFYPYSQSLAWTDNFILPSLLALPFSQLNVSNETIFNCLILVSNFLNGYCTYRLCYRITGENLTSFFGGAILMTCPYLSYQIGHPQLQFFFFIPLSISILFSFYSHKQSFQGIYLGLCLFFCFLTSVYYAIFIALIITSILTITILLRPKAFSWRELYKLTASTTFGSLPVIPFLLPYLSVQETFGERFLYEAYYYSANIWSYLSASPENLLYYSTSAFTHSEAHLFPGIVVVILAIKSVLRLGEAKQLNIILRQFSTCLLIALLASFTNNIGWTRFLSAILFWCALILALKLIIELGKLERRLGVNTITQRNMICIFSFLALIFLIFSFGPLGNPEKGHLALSPFRLVFDYFPGASAIRAVSRYGIVTIFSLIVLSVFTLAKLRTKTNLHSLSFVVFGFMLFENFQTSYPLSSPSPTPDIFNQLSNLDKSGSAAISLPYADSLNKNGEVESWSQYARFNITYLLWAQNSLTPLVNGYSGQKTKLMRELPRELNAFPDNRSIRALSSIVGLRYIIYNSRFVTNFNATEFQRKVKLLEPYIKIISNDDWGTYLIELNDERIVNSELELIMPARHEGKLSIELRAGYKSEYQNLNLDVHIEDPAGNIKIGSINIPGDGSWVQAPLHIPKANNSVRPRKIFFEALNNVPIVIRKSQFIRE